MTVLSDDVRLLLTTEPMLAGRIGMLTLGGSLAYGTNLPGKGDIDLRGFAFEPAEQVIGIVPNFETIQNKETDTVIYSFNKFVKLLKENNPNILETMGCRADQYVFAGPVAQELAMNLDKFLHKRVFHTFGGYAKMQLDRMENIIYNNSMDGRREAEHIKNALERAMYNFSERYSKFASGSVAVRIVPSEDDPEETNVVLDIHLEDFPIEQVAGMLSEFKNIKDTHKKLRHRNRKSTPEKLDKHAMHIIRLLENGTELLETGKMVTYRDKVQDLLLSIRKGEFRNPDGTYNKEFYDLKAEFERRFEKAKANTVLPDRPDMAWINDFVCRVNKQIVQGTLETMEI